MAMLNLALLKKHVRADDFTDDDEYLEHLLETALQYVCQSTNRTSEDLLAMGEAGDYPAPLKQAVLMIAGHWYNQREVASVVNMQEVPYSVQALIKPFRRLV